MNHDATHCLDYLKKECPKTCYRAQLTEELKQIYYPLPISWAHFEGTNQCEKTVKMDEEESIEMETKRTPVLADIKYMMLEENCHTIKVWDDGGKRRKVFRFVGWEDREDD